MASNGHVDGHGAPIPEICMTHVVAQTEALTLDVDISTSRQSMAVSATVDVLPHRHAGALPSDLLAVLGWDWSLLQAGRMGWQGSVHLRGAPPARTEAILLLGELTAADQRPQISAYALILDRRVGNYVLPDGWMVVAAGNASLHGAVCHDLGTELADRMFHFNVQTAIDAFLVHALANGFAAEVMASLKVRPDKLDDTQAPLAGDRVVGASLRGWEDVSRVLRSGLPDDVQRLFVQGRIGAANAAEFFGVLRESQAALDVAQLLAARPGAETTAPMPRSLDGLYGMIYGLLATCADDATLARALEVLGQLPTLRGTALPLREVQTLAMELLMQRALERGHMLPLLDNPAYQGYAEQRREEAAGASDAA